MKNKSVPFFSFPFIRLVLVMIVVVLTGCMEKTVGQQFRDIMVQIDTRCRHEKLGPYLDKNDPDYRDKIPRTDCDILKIKPSDPLATEEGRFAYSIQLPPPYDQTKVKYRQGMSAETYFNELCEKDAGEWIFKKVEGVEGVFQGRQRESYSGGYSDLIFFSREFLDGISSEENLVQPYIGHYNFFERLAENGEGEKPYIRYFRGSENKTKYKAGYPSSKNGSWVYLPYVVNYEQVDLLKSRYAFTSRHVSTNEITENGIEGSETIIFDRTTNKVLAFRRTFVRYWPRSDSRYTRLTNSDRCQLGLTKGVSQFIQNVLIPVNHVE